MPVIIEFSRCIGTYLSAKFELQNIRPYIVCGENWLDKQPERSE